MIFYVDCTYSCCLIEASSRKQALEDAYYDEGRNNVNSVREATPEDVQWIAAIGGYVPDAAKAMLLKKKKGKAG